MDRTARVGRRGFVTGALSGVLAATAELQAASPTPPPARPSCRSDRPIECIVRERFDTLVALVDAQLHALWGGPPDEDPLAVARDCLRYAQHLDLRYQQALCMVLGAIEWYSVRQTFRPLARLPVCERRSLLNQGEWRGCPHDHRYPLICWEHDYALHSGISGVAMLVRLVTNSRVAGRRLIGFRWSPQCRDPNNLVHVPPPPYPDLSQWYDVCVIGSGAGGSVVAARAAEAGLRVLIVEEGDWISPSELIERVRDEDGREMIWPARDDVALARLFRGAAVNLAGTSQGYVGGSAGAESPGGIVGTLLMYRRIQNARPRQRVNVIQAKVVGGGPYINNAIHLEMDEPTWNRWAGFQPAGVTYQDFYARMQQVKEELGVNTEAAAMYSGDRSLKFVQACRAVGEEALPVPVAMVRSQEDDPSLLDADSATGSLTETKSCVVCGSDNAVDPFGGHIGGLHPYRPGRPNSFLMRALNAERPAEIAYSTAALRLRFAAPQSSEAAGQVRCLVAEDRRDCGPRCPGRRVTIHARCFVLAAGPAASTTILAQSLKCSDLCVDGLGQHLTGNVIAPVYAVYDRPIDNGRSKVVEPGVAQCYYVKRRTGADGDEPALENWFHYPGSLAIALTGWFDEYASVMRRYEHIAVCGMVVPTKVRPENHIDQRGRIRLSIDQEEFELLLAGIRKIGRIFLAGCQSDDGVTLYLPTKAILLDGCCRPVQIRDLDTLDWALAQIRGRGPAFLNLATAHPQGGNPLGRVVQRDTFRVQDVHGRPIENLYVADGSVLPFGCDVNPQLTIKALAMYAADALLKRLEIPSGTCQTPSGYGRLVTTGMVQRCRAPVA